MLAVHGLSEMHEFTPEEERAERAARVRSMLQRWAQEPEGNEPDWFIEDVAPLALRREAETEDAEIFGP